MLSAIVRIGYAIVLLTSYPLVHFALRARILEALDHATGKPQRLPSPADDNPSPSHGSGPPDPHHTTAATPHVTLATSTSDTGGWSEPRVSSRRKSLASTVKNRNMQAENGVNSSDRSSLERGNDSEREPHTDDHTLQQALRRSEDAATATQGRARQRGDRGSSLALSGADSPHQQSPATRLLSTHQEMLRGKRTPASLTPSSSHGQLNQGGGSNLRPMLSRGLASSTAEARRSAANLDQVGRSGREGCSTGVRVAFVRDWAQTGPSNVVFTQFLAKVDAFLLVLHCSPGVMRLLS